MYFAHVILDDVAAGNVLEHDRGEGEIEFHIAQYSQVLTVILKDPDVGAVGQGQGRLADHFAADIDTADLAEQVGKCAGDAPGAAANLEHAHLPGVLALTDVSHIGEDFFGDSTLAGAEKILV